MMQAKFSSGYCDKCRQPVLKKQWIERYGRFWAHVTCPAAAPRPTVAAPELQPVVAYLSGIAADWTAKSEQGIDGFKTPPHLTFLGPDGVSELSIQFCGPKSKAEYRGGVHVVLGDDVWQGHIKADGTMLGGRLLNNAALKATLLAIAADPAQKAREYGALTRKCTVCRHGLSDEDGSVALGYGPVCAKKVGWPHHRGSGAGVPKAVPVAA